MQVIDDALLGEFRVKGRCEWCGKVKAVEPHHLFSRGMGGGSRLDLRSNLVALCRSCHQAHHDGKEPDRAALLALVARRIGIDPEALNLYLRRLIHASRKDQARDGDGEVGPDNLRDDVPPPEPGAEPGRGQPGLAADQEWERF